MCAVHTYTRLHWSHGDIQYYTINHDHIIVHLKGGTKSVLIRGTYYQGWFMYMWYAQGQNEEYLLSRSVY